MAAGATQSLTWANLRPGTYLIESGTHPSIQAPMGLYGVLRVTDPAELIPHLFDEIERLIPILEGSTRDRLKAIIALAHNHEFPRLRMVLAYIGASYNWSRKLEEEHRALHRRLAKVLGAIVADGVHKGEIRDGIDPDLLVEMISSVYLRNYRTAYYAGFEAHELDARIDRQIDLLFDGASAR